MFYIRKAPSFFPLVVGVYTHALLVPVHNNIMLSALEISRPSAYPEYFA